MQEVWIVEGGRPGHGKLRWCFGSEGEANKFVKENLVDARGTWVTAAYKELHPLPTPILEYHR